MATLIFLFLGGVIKFAGTSKLGQGREREKALQRLLIAPKADSFGHRHVLSFFNNVLGAAPAHKAAGRINET
jgi:hypothetical protein